MNGPSQESLERRLDRLERSLRRWRIGLFGGLLLLAVASLAALATGAFGRALSGPAEELVVRSLVLVDGEGKLRALLDAYEPGPELALYDAQGKVRARLIVTKDGPGLGLSDAQGLTRAWLGLTKDEPGLALHDAQWQTRAWLAVGKDGPMLALYDTQETARAVVGTTELETVGTGATENTGPSSIVLFDKRGKLLWRAP